MKKTLLAVCAASGILLAGAAFAQARYPVQPQGSPTWQDVRGSQNQAQNIVYGRGGMMQGGMMGFRGAGYAANVPFERASGWSRASGIVIHGISLGLFWTVMVLLILVLVRKLKRPSCGSGCCGAHEASATKSAGDHSEPTAP